MNKISYPIVAYQVESLYAREISPSDNDAIIEHCEFIANYIESCGYTINEYLELMWNDGAILN